MVDLASKTLLFVGGGMETVPGIHKAHAMGLHVVVSDMNPRAPGISAADDCLIASTYDIAATVSAARKYHQSVRRLDGVMCLATDVPLTVATVAAELDLPGIPVTTAALAMDKLAMKEKFLADNIPVPWFHVVESAAHLRKLMTQQGMPLIIKPVDSRGARGVLQLHSAINPDWAYAHAVANSPSGRAMVEAYLAGPQISTEALLIDGKGITVGFADRNYEFLERFSPYIIENGGSQPSILPEAARTAISECALDAARSLGIVSGIAKGDMVWTTEGPKVIEIAARLSGGWFCTDQIPLATGVDLVQAAILLALGAPIHLEEHRPRPLAGVAIRYFFPSPGKVVRIEGFEAAQQLPGVHRLELFIRPGDLVEPVVNHPSRAGFVITVGDDHQQAIDRAVAALKTVTIVTSTQ